MASVGDKSCYKASADIMHSQHVHMSSFFVFEDKWCLPCTTRVGDLYELHYFNSV